ncbi:MAG: hypothetical protein AABO41_16160 [Acidobacteriota bacterium]
MLTIISAGAIALAFTLIVHLLQTRNTDAARVEEIHGALLMVGVQIICGDCSGDEESPIRTYMDRYGNCAQCGGHSYLLASSLALNSAALRASRLIQAHSAASGGRVLAFEARARASRSQKIAV